MSTKEVHMVLWYEILHKIPKTFVGTSVHGTIQLKYIYLYEEFMGKNRICFPLSQGE